MPRHQEYPDLVTHRKRSALPPKLQMDIVELSGAVHRGKDVQTHLSSYISEIKTLPAAAIVRAAADIQTAGNLYFRHHTKEGFRSSLIPTAVISDSHGIPKSVLI